MSHSCFCTSDSHLKCLFHLKYSSETWSHLAASLSPVRPGYTTRFAFKEGPDCVSATGSQSGGARLTGVHSALGIATELHLCTDETISPDKACRSNVHPPCICLRHEPFMSAHSLYWVPRLHFWVVQSKSVCEKTKQKSHPPPTSNLSAIGRH